MDLKDSKKEFWRISKIEVITYLIIFILTTISSPIIAVWFIFGSIATNSYMPILSLMVIIITIQGLPIVYLNIKKSMGPDKLTQSSRLIRFLKLQLKTLIITLVIDVIVFMLVIIYFWLGV